MTGKPRTIALMGALACGIAVPAWAATSHTSSQDLQTQIAQLKAQVAQLQQSQDSNWLNAQRAEQVKGLIREVLADSKTRSTLLSEGATAGYDPDSGFFLASADDAFRVNVSGVMQFRYIWNNGQHNTDNSDRNQNGFQIPLLSVRFDGHVSNPRLTYRLWLSEVNDGGESDIFAEEAWAQYQIDDNWGVRVGRQRVPFSRETLVDSEYQLAVERSTVDNFFSPGHATGVTAFYTSGNVKGALSFDQGFNERGVTDYDQSDLEYDLTGRVDVKLAGNWEQEEDFNTFSGQPQSAFVGAAVRYGNGDDENGSDTNTFEATVDGSYTNNGLTTYGALFWSRNDNKAGVADSNNYGILAQAGYSINDKWEPFARWEFLKFNGTGSNDNFQAVTVGVNYFLNKNRAKITTDLVWAYQNPGSFGGDDLHGMDNLTGEGEALALRAQFQLLF